MFTAIDESNTLIFADKIKTSKRKTYKCPGCKEHVFFKNGTSKTPHFSHYAHSKCQTFSEGETEEHLKGKKLIYDFLKNKNESVFIEPYLSNLKQRPDLLWKTKTNKKIAIEFQCSSLASRQIVERNKGYFSEGYEVIWIAGTKHHFTNKLTMFQKLMLTDRFMETPTFFQLTVKSKKIDLLKNIRYNLLNRFVYDKESIYLKKKSEINKISNYEQVITKPKNFKMKHYELQTGKTYSNKSLHGFFRLMYQNGDSIISIPIELYQTIGLEWILQTHSFEWKYRMILWVENLSRNTVITIKKLRQWLKNQIEQKNIVLYETPLLSDLTRIRPFVQFLDSLTKNGGLKKTGSDKWTVIKDFKRFKYLEEKQLFFS